MSIRGYEHKPILGQPKHGSVLSVRYGRSQADPLLSIRGYFMVWPIRRLVTADGAAFRALRLEALQTYPDAFGSTYEDEVTRPINSFIQQLEKSVVLGGFDHGELAGMIGFYRQ